MVFKVDFEKAYDSVSWQFLLYMMGRMGFHDKWITLPLFYLSFYRAPSAVINRLNVIQRHFLWGGNSEGKKIAWLAWNKVCSSRETGGLGIKDIKAFNNALLIKWKWMMFQQSDQLW
ncbi:Putative ribonuclease H protein, partial [Glycine soja]